jgi:hypothetical protein
MKDKIQLTPLENSLCKSFKAHFENGKYLGKMVKDVDGYYYFEVDSTSKGLWSSYGLNLVIKSLDLLNKDLEEETKKYFNKN